MTSFKPAFSGSEEPILASESRGSGGGSLAGPTGPREGARGAGGTCTPFPPWARKGDVAGASPASLW